MNDSRISAIPPGEAAAVFAKANVSVLQISTDHIPDLDPDPIDQVFHALQTAMFGRVQRPLTEVRRWLDVPPSRRDIACLDPEDAQPPEVSSDIALGAIILRVDSPFGLLYEWPDRPPIVYWRGQLFDRDKHGVLTQWIDPEAGDA